MNPIFTIKKKNTKTDIKESSIVKYDKIATVVVSAAINSHKEA